MSIYEAPKFKERPYLASVPTPSELQLPGRLLTRTISVTRKRENSTSLLVFGWLPASLKKTKDMGSILTQSATAASRMNI